MQFNMKWFWRLTGQGLYNSQICEWWHPLYSYSSYWMSTANNSNIFCMIFCRGTKSDATKHVLVVALPDWILEPLTHMHTVCQRCSIAYSRKWKPQDTLPDIYLTTPWHSHRYVILRLVLPLPAACMCIIHGDKMVKKKLWTKWAILILGW